MRRPRRHLGAGAAASIAALLATGVSRAQNADSFFFSNEAALTAGAMVAVAGDEGSAWYNPAGLGSLRRTRLNANGSVFGVRVRSVERGLTSNLDGLSSTVDYGGTDFITTPTTASASFSLLPNLTLSGGVFNTSHDVRAASGTERVGGPGGRALSQRIESLAHLRRMNAGGAYGFDAGHGVRVGGGMFLVYSVRDSAVDYLVGVDGGGQKAEVVSYKPTAGASGFGLQPTSGLQWDVSKSLHLGVMFRFPELRLHTSQRGSTTQVVGEADGASFAILDDKRSSGRVRWSDPARLFFGVAYEPSRAVRIALDADVSFALQEDSWGRSHDATLRARAGVIVKAVDMVHVGFGAFVDPASERALADTPGSIRADYFGGTSGVILRTRIGGDPGPDAPIVTLCIAVRYAVGVGDARTVIIAEQGGGLRRQPITVHDVMPYFGSSVAF
ncbi:MAG: hypothetical protein JST00_13840 [Deltaproteobacteria bacterium]|nr:hypothetical protein [Deltaproteobacteria bacterium]